MTEDVGGAIAETPCESAHVCGMGWELVRVAGSWRLRRAHEGATHYVSQCRIVTLVSRRSH